jgi:hypothetical protein
MSTIATSETPEARELNLVGKVELRIALAESDAKLQSTLNTYLPPLLLKLASDFVSVRNKVGYSTSGNDVILCTHRVPLSDVPYSSVFRSTWKSSARLINIKILGRFCLSTY